MVDVRRALSSTHTHTYTYTHTHSLTHSLSLSHTRTHTNSLSLSLTHALSHTKLFSHTLSCTHTHTRRCTTTRCAPSLIYQHYMTFMTFCKRVRFITSITFYNRLAYAVMNINQIAPSNPQLGLQVHHNSVRTISLRSQGVDALFQVIN